ncbi:serine/threonine protein kinase [Hyalangium minutum]|uniref:Protein kinase domain-containing protein n=1 Tax=Hyalangium minutum TaxID=394096 RepID=A0A085W5G9_9BACT|nr:serine/threonine-protein kinase [Hyalangium minutum]KFE62932.1 hypothetical protein DB31_2991 [Hyalangium minutum]
MERESWVEPDALPEGTVVGKWRVERGRGRGSYGAVYRAKRVGRESGEPVALKMAMYPMDARFEREWELLSRMKHPHVPELLDRGWWRGPGGRKYPYAVMRWVEGEDLYWWAARPERTWREAVRALAQVASALAALHALEGVHRDVKGENILVRRDGSAVLLDFGSGNYRGARRLTRSPEPPGTPQYWSPESLRFQWKKRDERQAHYESTPADDVYALGMTAWRVVVGRFPEPLPDPDWDNLEGSAWLEHRVAVPPEALEGAGEELKAVILKMMSSRPEDRGSAAQAVKALKRAERKAGRRADRLLRGWKEPPPVRYLLRERVLNELWRWRQEWLAAVVGAGVTLLVWNVDRYLPARGEARQRVAQAPRAEEGVDAGTSELADTAISARATVDMGGSRPGGVALEMPKKPLPGQRQPPCKYPAVAINGGCWGRFADAKPPCGDEAYEWGDGCYWPMWTAGRPPTSEPK